MTEQSATPQGEPYGLAVAALQEHAAGLPALVLIQPDGVLWGGPSKGLSAGGFQLLDQAGAVLSALRARGVPVALAVAAEGAATLRQCLEEANLQQTFAAVVEYPAEQQQQQQESPVLSAARAVKARLGVPWQQTLCLSADASVVRQASRLGMAAVRVGASGLDVAALRAGLAAYEAKAEADRGY